MSGGVLGSAMWEGVKAVRPQLTDKIKQDGFVVRLRGE